MAGDNRIVTPTVAENLDNLRYLVFQGMKGDTGATGPQGADGADGHSPIIGQNGNWWTWDKNLPGYIDTHVPAFGIGEQAKQALLDCFNHVAWISDDDGAEYISALEDALYPPPNLVSISAVFTPGTHVVCDTDSLDSLKPYLVVTAQYQGEEGESTEEVTNYVLSGTLNVGTSTITVSYSGKTTTFSVTVVATPEVSSISAVFTQGQNTIYETDSLDTLRQYLTVTATFEDQTTRTVTTYTLSGTLAVGTSVITAAYEGKTASFNVTVTAVPADLIYSEPLVMVATASGNGTWDSANGTGTIIGRANGYPALVPQGLLYQYRNITDKTLRMSLSVTVSGLESGKDVACQIVLFSTANPSNNGNQIVARYTAFSTSQNGTFTPTITKTVSELFENPDGGGYLGFQIYVYNAYGAQVTVSNIVAEVV